MGGIEEHGILENLGNSRLVSSHFPKNQNLNKNYKLFWPTCVMRLRMATGANEINCHLVSDYSPKSLGVE